MKNQNHVSIHPFSLFFVFKKGRVLSVLKKIQVLFLHVCLINFYLRKISWFILRKETYVQLIRNSRDPSLLSAHEGCDYILIGYGSVLHVYIQVVCPNAGIYLMLQITHLFGMNSLVINVHVTFFMLLCNVFYRYTLYWLFRF